MNNVKHTGRNIRDDIIIFFFFNDTATTEIYTLSLHDALPICWFAGDRGCGRSVCRSAGELRSVLSCGREDRKSTRLNSSHLVISYAVFCLKKKKVFTLTLCNMSQLRRSHHMYHS